MWSKPEAGRLRRGSGYPLTATALETAAKGYIAEISVMRDYSYSPKLQRLRVEGLESDTSLWLMWLSLRLFDWGYVDVVQGLHC